MHHNCYYQIVLYEFNRIACDFQAVENLLLDDIEIVAYWKLLSTLWLVKKLMNVIELLKRGRWQSIYRHGRLSLNTMGPKKLCLVVFWSDFNQPKYLHILHKWIFVYSFIEVCWILKNVILRCLISVLTADYFFYFFPATFTRLFGLHAYSAPYSMWKPIRGRLHIIF